MLTPPDQNTPELLSPTVLSDPSLTPRESPSRADAQEGFTAKEVSGGAVTSHNFCKTQHLKKS